MSDESIIVKNQGTIFLGGTAPGSKLQLAKSVTAEDLGGGDMSHTRLSGVADHLAQDDSHALAPCPGELSLTLIARKLVPASDICTPAEPHANPEELYGVIPTDHRKPYDVRDVIARLVDGSEFDEFKARYGSTLVCGFAHLWGYPVGFVANNGILFFRIGTERDAFHRALLSAKNPSRLFAEHRRIYGWPEI